MLSYETGTFPEDKAAHVQQGILFPLSSTKPDKAPFTFSALGKFTFPVRVLNCSQLPLKCFFTAKDMSGFFFCCNKPVFEVVFLAFWLSLEALTEC